MEVALNPQQQMFADYYLVEPNATEAAKKAGYSEKTAYSQGQRLLKHVEVRAYIDEKMTERSEKLNIEAEWVLAKLVQVADRSMKAEPVMKWDYEERALKETGEYQFDSQGANRALELIGKHLGMFKDKIEHSGTLGVQIVDDIK
ncbi:terminase small subunit [Cohnella kolymensis]|uniref:terminase small subunit n=1 Tax=Cohnella kolymensis TaxID=1590652 RepID=UPI0009E1A09F|nr:terminase small subunit [Cohnella kolymensis]